ncbi:hypothetical protein ACFQYP_64145 [Nonomuraea antimicrobica]
MRILLVGAGGVGTAITRIAARRPFFDHMVVADYDLPAPRRPSPPWARRPPGSPRPGSTPPT